jgi:hypothetical protein
MRPAVDGVTNQTRELELVVDSMERRKAERRSARERQVEPRLPPKHVPAGRKVIRESAFRPRAHAQTRP